MCERGEGGRDKESNGSEMHDGSGEDTASMRSLFVPEFDAGNVVVSVVALL